MTPGTFQPRDPDFAPRIHASFAQQAAMHTLGATLQSVAPGEVTIAPALPRGT